MPFGLPSFYFPQPFFPEVAKELPDVGVFSKKGG